MRKIIVVLSLLAILAACSSIDCPLNHRVYTKYGLYQPDGKPDTLDNDTLWIWARRGNRVDTLVLNRLYGSTATSFELPISYMQPEDTFFVLLGDETRHYYPDSIYVRKESFQHFESIDCQASYFHHVTSVRCMGNIIDSIVIINSDINYDKPKEHFRIYLDPDI